MKHLLRGIIETRDVFLDDRRLDPARSQMERNHSPDGFSWGYGGSGCAQLALAVLLEIYKDNKQKAIAEYQAFKWDVISKLPQTDFEIDFDLPAEAEDANEK